MVVAAQRKALALALASARDEAEGTLRAAAQRHADAQAVAASELVELMQLGQHAAELELARALLADAQLQLAVEVAASTQVPFN
ncbi:hypothetical protein T492DRAFT_856709 [Pavlovales sp. CCMP2436]|nr:hypothetical protein T492DRAFT_856709 [Pavlovales sp. CCMP2436]